MGRPVPTEADNVERTSCEDVRNFIRDIRKFYPRLRQDRLIKDDGARLLAALADLKQCAYSLFDDVRLLKLTTQGDIFGVDWRTLGRDIVHVTFDSYP